MVGTPIAVEVAAGDGLVGRYGEVIVFTGVDDDRVPMLLACAKAAAQLPDPGAALLDKLVPVVAGTVREVAFGIVAPAADGLLVLLRGPMNADVVIAGSGFRLSGSWSAAGGSPWLSQFVPAETATLTVAHRRPGARPSPNSDLVAGVVPGGGFVRRRVSVVDDPLAAAKTVVQPGAAAAATTVVVAAAPMTETLTVARPSQPMETSSVSTSVGVLAAADGAYFPLDRAYVIGRSPLSDEAVRHASASPIVVPYDPYVSRVHTYITIVNGAVYVRDAGTSEGTFIAAPGAPDWVRVGEGPELLSPGWSLRVGNWIAVHQAGIQR